MTEFCSNCGVLCCGDKKFQIEARKGVYYPFCSHCFNLLRNIDLKEIRKLIKKRNI